ncbi:hypothetical protein HMPREF1987_02033 [Peptostreptococcaceae bacterium oral taxon 113 str. W5053]|nr:hypothetical protein HMPREF1987_02033 [Peptostreptococcaceae bacterium oral taxon 113 str. W5053]
MLKIKLKWYSILLATIVFVHPIYHAYAVNQRVDVTDDLKKVQTKTEVQELDGSTSVIERFIGKDGLDYFVVTNKENNTTTFIKQDRNNVYVYEEEKLLQTVSKVNQSQMFFDKKYSPTNFMQPLGWGSWHSEGTTSGNITVNNGISVGVLAGLIAITLGLGEFVSLFISTAISIISAKLTQVYYIRKQWHRADTSNPLLVQYQVTTYFYSVSNFTGYIGNQAVSYIVDYTH